MPPGPRPTCGRGPKPLSLSDADASRVLSFTVVGKAVPQGSKRAFPVKSKDGATRAVMVEASGDRHRTYRQEVRSEAMRVSDLECGGAVPYTSGQVGMSVVFYVQRPKNHYARGDRSLALRRDAPSFVGKAPDLSKLVRSVEDSLTGVLYRDDAQLAWCQSAKVFAEEGERERTEITVWRL